MFADYKFSRVVRDDSGTTAFVRFYEGDNAMVPDPVTGVPAQQYQRTALLQERVFYFTGDVSDADLRDAVNVRLKDFVQPGRPVLPQQVAKGVPKVLPIRERVL